MASRSDISVRWDRSPRIVLVAAPSTEVIVQDLLDTLRDLEQEVRSGIYRSIVSAGGKEDLGGGVSVGVTLTLQDAQLAFEERRTKLSTGTVTTGDTDGLILTDSAATFIADGVAVGDMVFNKTDVSFATVVRVIGEMQLQMLTPLAAGTDNQFDVSDAYEVMDWVRCDVSGGNLVAVDSDGVTIPETLETFGTQVNTAKSSQATALSQLELEHATFNGGVTIDTVNGAAGTAYPTGTPRVPSSNLIDATAIAATRGLTVFFLVGSLTVLSTDTISSMKIFGQSRSLTTLTFQAGATITNVDVHECTVSGVFGGGSTMEDCGVSTLSVFDGVLLRCALETTITLGNSAAARFINCYSGVPGAATPIIDMGGSGQSLLMRGYQGGIEIRNRTGTDACSIDINSGQVVIASTVTAGTIIVRGVGRLADSSGAGATVNATDLISGQDFLDLRDTTIAAVEYQRGAHTAETYLYVSPASGLDTNDGLTRAQPKLTIAAALAAVTQEHTAIIVLNGSTGQLVVTENVVLSTRFTFLRGPGLDVQLIGASDASPTISIAADGCEVSGFEVTTPGTGTPDALSVTAEFARLRRLRVLNARRHGINCVGGDRLRLEECIIEGSGVAGAGVGLRLANTDFALVDVKTIITGSADDNVLVDPSGGTAVDNVIDDMTLSNSVGGFGVRVVTGAVRTRITNISFSGNSSGDVGNSGTGTVVHDTVLDNYAGVIVVDPTGTAGRSFPIGTREVPVSNLADAYIIADAANINRFFIEGDVTVPSARSNALFEGRDISVELDLDSQNLDGSVIRRLTVVNNGAGADLIFEGCILNSTTNWVGLATACQLDGTITLANGTTVFLECFSAIEGIATPVIDLVGAGRALGLRIYSGGVEIRNMTDVTNQISVDLVAGQVILPASNVGGLITLRGIGNLTDNTNGATVERNAFLNLADITTEMLDQAGAADGRTWRELLRGFAAAILGKSSGSAANAPVHRAADDGKARITATTNDDGDRLTVALDLAP